MDIALAPLVVPARPHGPVRYRRSGHQPVAVRSRLRLSCAFSKREREVTAHVRNRGNHVQERRRDRADRPRPSSTCWTAASIAAPIRPASPSTETPWTASCACKLLGRRGGGGGPVRRPHRERARQAQCAHRRGRAGGQQLPGAGELRRRRPEASPMTSSTPRR